MVLMACLPLKRRSCEDLAFLSSWALSPWLCFVLRPSVTTPCWRSALDGPSDFWSQLLKNKNHRKAGVTRYTAWLLTLRCCLDCTWQRSSYGLLGLNLLENLLQGRLHNIRWQLLPAFSFSTNEKSLPSYASDHCHRQLKGFFSCFSQWAWKDHLLSLFRGAPYALEDCYRVVL